MAMVLGRDMTGRILAALYMAPFQSASDVAKRFGIHIATAQKYLMEMRQCGLLESRWRKNTNRPTEEYWLAKKKFDIEIDLENMPRLSELEKKAANIFIRQKYSELVAFDTNRNLEKITEILLLDGQESSRIEQRIKLDDIEGRFTWYLPSPTEPPMSILELVEKAKLSKTDLPRIMELVDRLVSIELDSSTGRIGIIERTGVINDE
jgi:transposase